MEELNAEILELMESFKEQVAGTTKKSQREARKTSLDLRKKLADFRKQSLAADK